MEATRTYKGHTITRCGLSWYVDRTPGTIDGTWCKSLTWAKKLITLRLEEFDRLVRHMIELIRFYGKGGDNATEETAHNVMRNELESLTEDETRRLCLECCKILGDKATKASVRNNAIYALHDACHDTYWCIECPMDEESGK